MPGHVGHPVAAWTITLYHDALVKIDIDIASISISNIVATTTIELLVAVARGCVAAAT